MSNNFVFKALHILSWIIFVGLCIEAGGLIVNFIVSIYNPEFIRNLYQKLDLISLYQLNKAAFFGIYSFILFISVLKAYLFYIVVCLLSKLDLHNPFNQFASHQISRISYFTFSIGIISYIARKTARNLGYHNYGIEDLEHFWSDAQAYILMAGVIYVIAAIFKKGVEIQSENDLTV